MLDWSDNGNAWLNIHRLTRLWQEVKSTASRRIPRSQLSQAATSDPCQTIWIILGETLNELGEPVACISARSRTLSSRGQANGTSARLRVAHRQDKRTTVCFARLCQNNNLLSLTDVQARLTRILASRWPVRRSNMKLRLNPDKKIGHDSLAWA